jgi:hypothetical protein
MPAMHVALAHANGLFGDPDLVLQHKEKLVDLFGPGANRHDIAAFVAGADGPMGKALPAGVSQAAVGNYAAELPETIMEVSRAVIFQNLQRDRPLGMTFAWLPAYEHEITVCESPATEHTPGWITVLMRGIYPGDPHPITKVAIGGTRSTDATAS